MSRGVKTALAALLTSLVLAGCAAERHAPELTPEPVPTAPAEAASAESAAAPAADTAEPETDGEANDALLRLAEAQKIIRTKKIGRYGMVPVYGRDVADGVYPIHVDSSSPFFRIVSAELIVENGEMFGRIEIPSMSYLWVYPGSKLEAAKADQSRWLGFEEANHHTVFTLPVPALDAEVDCAAYSKAREIWYDRKLVFYASSLPKEALAFPLPDYELIETAVRGFSMEGLDELLSAPEPERAKNLPPPEPVAVELPDGEYSIEVNMTGGSGRASVSSPTLLIVRGGRAWARLLWSSAYYDYMIVDDAWFYNLTTDGGNSAFEIPITRMDDPISVVADTTTMGDALEIDYTLTFYSDSVGSKGQIPQEAAKKVLILAGTIIAAGGVLNYFVKKRRER